ncbi:FAD-dependent oxidoreductase [Aaosphaeria arxii CBS 175.79]|uniref:FAD-dependent oxidoreductase n=1 Tax=Aaosphaeria arxii CBS 175.79 TaxID=1450172 RepID=A0A6A5X7Y2_9PLEO|nr:FAD-dependent oxidoreductase [Aaosphaeria arxii CBS 175.79]KAF2009053.1 FAD-dependent oxidoreductase [Aaosphaeria arxii CBS 175.79]
MALNERIVIVGAGVFGLSTALELSKLGYKDIVVLDRHVPPVPDGSSVDISRIIRFDYSDPTYFKIAKEAYESWSSEPQYKGIFYSTPYAAVVSENNTYGRKWVDKCVSHLTDLGLAHTKLPNAKTAKEIFPTLTGDLLQPDLVGYSNAAAGWADAAKGVALFRNLCIERGISFISGAQGTVTGLEKDASSGRITAVKTKSGHNVTGQHFILATGAWTSSLVPMYNSALTTGQVLAFTKLTPEEVKRLKDLPIYINFDSGWFCFPPHEDTAYLKCAIHGWGYTRTEPNVGEASKSLSTPPTAPRSARPNFAPEDGIKRLRDGLREILPDIAARPFDRTAVCWYTDTPTGDFIFDFHPDHSNLFLATGGSGQ